MPSKLTKVVRHDQKHIQTMHAMNSMFRHAPFAACLVEVPAMIYIWANEHYCKTFQTRFSCEEVAGKTVFEVLVTPNPEAFEALQFVHQNNCSTNFDTIRSKTALGEETYWSAALFPHSRLLIEATGEIRTEVFSILFEVTDKVAAARIAEERLDKFKKDKEQKEKFLALVGHEFRTPLTSLKLLVDMLRSKLKILPLEKISELLTLTDTQICHLQRILNELDDSRGHCQFEYSAQSIRLKKFTKELFEEFKITYPEIQWNIEFPESEDALLFIDPQRLSQVLQNIVANAVKYSSSRSEIFCRILFQDKTAVIEIKDLGIGIDRNNLEHIFQRSFRIAQVPSPRGLGLGLYLSKQIIKQMDGNIWAKSPGLGKGTSILVQIPIIEHLKLKS